MIAPALPALSDFAIISAAQGRAGGTHRHCTPADPVADGFEIELVGEIVRPDLTIDDRNRIDLDQISRG